MPIRIPENLPARAILERENVPIIAEDRASHQDIRPLQVALLNLMPNKIKTETHFLRVLGSTPLQVEVTLLRPGTHDPKNASPEHLMEFYQTLDEVKHRRFDALIVTGAPIEHLPYERVTYWEELRGFFDWIKTNVYSTLFVCWGAQAALYHYHGVPKYNVEAKRFGIYLHHVLKPFEPITSGFDDYFYVPVARNTEVRHDDIVKVPGLDILVESEQTGLCLIQETAKRRFYMFNHLEYGANALRREYLRDLESGFGQTFPFNYFPEDNPDLAPRMKWRAHRALLFGNWLNMVYQGTPYDLADLQPVA